MTRKKQFLSLVSVTLTTMLPMLCAADTVWLSAADVATTSSEFVFPVAQRNIEANGARLMQVQTLKEGPHEATFTLTIKKTGQHTIWAATTPQNVSWASPFLVLIDNQPINNASDKATRSDPVKISPPAFGLKNNPGLFQWYCFGTTTLSAGNHTVTFRINTRRQLADAKGQSYTFFLDSLLVTDNTAFTPTSPGAKGTAAGNRN
ncbi:hypothetical protein Ga0100231_015225 [Opitutaceae bacterium TAV4]|nr:hypothetical protein Ga0100231_015225 [Opitutaceae bacterium TAV4]RRJ99631.1 hypothetical protein Ga0100230_016065 [Opitutaceae bacterium TAV3]